MARISKDPAIRMSEFVEVAEELFKKEGYFETQVSDIVNKLNVSQGSFYYYFKSKEDVLEEILERKIVSLINELTMITVSAKPNALQKMKTVINRAMALVGSNGDKLINMLADEKQLHLRDKLSRQSRVLFGKLLSELIEKGRDEGIFKVDNVQITSELIVQILNCLMDYIMEVKSNETLKEYVKGIEKMIALLLGVRAEDFSIQVNA